MDARVMPDESCRLVGFHQHVEVGEGSAFENATGAYRCAPTGWLAGRAGGLRGLESRAGGGEPCASAIPFCECSCAAADWCDEENRKTMAGWLGRVASDAVSCYTGRWHSFRKGERDH